MLLRAFGPAGAPFGEPVDAAATLTAARRFELSARIASRQGRARLAAELGEEGASGFLRDQGAAAALGMRLLSVARDIAGVAETLGLPLVFLKFVALDAAGLAVVGRRPACDVDVLVPAGRAAELQRALVARGYHDSGLPEGEHQLPALSHPGGGTVEVHRMVLGVRLFGKASATLEALEEAGLLLPAPGFTGRCAIPEARVLAAHALVHGIGQHGYWPDSYPLFKMVGDLIDLEVSTDGAWVGKDVSAAEVEAVRRLCMALAEGRDPVGWDDTAGETVLLRHLLAGRLDPDYAASLRLGLFLPQPSERGPAARLVHAVLDAIFLSRAQIDAIYGRPRHRLGYLARRLARPFDLLRRLGSYGARALKARS